MKRWLLLLAFAALGCAPAQADPPAAELTLASCIVPGIGGPAECGTLEVAENPDAPEGRKLGLRIVRLPARSDDASTEPLFLLAGGPGQAATEAYGPMLPLFGAINEHRDIVMVDQRGTGQSSPLDCETPERLKEGLVEGALIEVAQTCREKLDADLTQYSTRRAAADLDRVRSALGYGRINLLGGSYGTRLALEYARRHGESVRSIVIDGVAPRAMKLPLSMAEDGQRALDKLFEACAHEPRCAAAFGDLEKTFTEIAASFPREIAVRDPRTAEMTQVTMTRTLFMQTLRGLLYSPELTSLLPLTFQQVKAGDFQGFVAQALLLGESSEEMMSLGLFLSVVCGEDVTRITEDEIAAQTTGTFLGRAMIDELAAACKGWPKPQLDDDFAAPVKTAAPVLVLSGDVDPVTPPRWGEAAVEHLEHGRHLVVPRAGHGTILRGCTASLVADFIDKPETLAELDVKCLDDAGRDVPPFFIDFAGPPH